MSMAFLTLNVLPISLDINLLGSPLTLFGNFFLNGNETVAGNQIFKRLSFKMNAIIRHDFFTTGFCAQFATEKKGRSLLCNNWTQRWLSAKVGCLLGVGKYSRGKKFGWGIFSYFQYNTWKTRTEGILSMLIAIVIAEKILGLIRIP